jgi:hypothetical protein
MPVSKDLGVGNHVWWSSEAGHVRETSRRRITSAITFKGHTVRALKEEPRSLIKRDPTDHLLLDKGSAPRKLKSRQWAP